MVHETTVSTTGLLKLPAEMMEQLDGVDSSIAESDNIKKYELYDQVKQR